MTQLKSNELFHYGVKGMKWGVRKRSQSVDKGSDDFKRAKAIGKKRVHEMSNAELKALNERKNLETNYKRLSHNKAQKGEAAVKKVLGAAAMGVSVYNLVKSPAGKAGIAAATKILKTSGKIPVRTIVVAPQIYG